MSGRRNAVSAVVLLCGVLLFADRSAQATPCCPGDLDADGSVNAVDLAIVLGDWGPCDNCAGDFNRDGVVNAVDLAGVLGDWGSCVFAYGQSFANPEAEQIGLELLGASGPLLLGEEEYLRIDRDLALIRAFEPALAGEFHAPAWIPNQLLLSLIDGEPQEEYLCTNEFYQVVDVDLISQALNLYLLTYAGNLNIAALAGIYEELPAVNYAEPNGLIGGQNYWTPTPLAGDNWRWDIDDGWHDCFDGCDCHRVYVFRTDAVGTVQLISVDEFGAPWCEF